MEQISVLGSQALSSRTCTTGDMVVGLMLALWSRAFTAFHTRVSQGAMMPLREHITILDMLFVKLKSPKSDWCTQTIKYVLHAPHPA